MTTKHLLVAALLLTSSSLIADSVLRNPAMFYDTAIYVLGTISLWDAFRWQSTSKIYVRRYGYIGIHKILDREADREAFRRMTRGRILAACVIFCVGAGLQAYGFSLKRG